VWSRDGQIELQVLARGNQFTPGPHGAQVAAAVAARGGWETHIALSVDRRAEEIIAIARREGWRTGEFDRGGFFHSVEVWIEDGFLLELFDSEQTAQYRAFMTRRTGERRSVPAS